MINIPKVKFGYIMVKFETWHFANENPATAGFESVNNERRNIRRKTQGGHLDGAKANSSASYNISYDEFYGDFDGNAVGHRSLKREPSPYCDEFRFEYALDNGDISSLPF